jgi:hypothetical protein
MAARGYLSKLGDMDVAITIRTGTHQRPWCCMRRRPVVADPVVELEWEGKPRLHSAAGVRAGRGGAEMSATAATLQHHGRRAQHIYADDCIVVLLVER